MVILIQWLSLVPKKKVGSVANITPPEGKQYLSGIISGIYCQLSDYIYTTNEGNQVSLHSLLGKKG